MRCILHIIKSIHFKCTIQWLFATLLSCAAITINHLYSIFIFPRRSLTSICSYSHSQAQAPTDLFYVYKFAFSGHFIHINEIMQYVVTCVWLLSLCKMFLRFICDAVCVVPSFLLSNSILLYECATLNIPIYQSFGILVVSSLGLLSTFRLFCNENFSTSHGVGICFTFSCIDI